MSPTGIPADVPERRRIEIRLRKSVPHETTASIALPPAVTLPKPRPVAKPRRQPQPLSLMPAPNFRQIITPANRMFAAGCQVV